MDNPFYKYFIIFGSNEYEVQPLNLYDARLSYTQNYELLRSYDISISSLVFTSPAYTILKFDMSIDSDQPRQFYIRRRLDNYTSNWKEFEFTYRDCKFNEDEKTATITFANIDNLACIIKKWNVDYNIVNVPYLVESKAAISSRMQFVTVNAQYGPDAPAPGYELLDGFIAIDGNKFFLFARETSTIQPEPGWQEDEAEGVYAINWSINYPTLNADIVRIEDDINPPDNISNWILIVNRWFNSVNIRYWVKDTDIADNSYNVAYKNGRKLKDVINYLFAQMGCGVTVISSFLFSDNYENETSPGTNNYVTGVLNQLTNIVIHQTTDIKRPNATQQATNLNVSLKELLEALQVLFDVQCFIDENGFFRIEHVSYFDEQVGIDISDSKYELRKNE